VAYPCLEIAADPDKVYDYTIKNNLVAVLTNGTAVLGLGNIGPEAAKPVMEGKAVLFKKFAGIDVFDIEIRANTVEEFVAVAKALEPTFGGINMEDVKAPESFEIEARLVKELKIPVMHDDQHGTAIISSAALLNALQLSGKDIGQVKMVVLGAGAAAISCATLYIELGLKRENINMFDIDGHVHVSRTDMDPWKGKFAQNTPKPLSLMEAFEGADVFLGLSSGNIVTGEMLKRMGSMPIVLALANPDPEISYEAAIAARPDAVVATGRSDYPNQVNNVLGFPYIFRGALDVRATTINKEMKLAAARAIAQLAHEPVPESVNDAYGTTNLTFGNEYLIPKPVDPRLITRISMAVAKAAIESGVARITITDWPAYEMELQARVGLYEALTKTIIEKAKRSPRKVVFGDADTYKILKAAQILNDEKIAIPILLGRKNKINALIEEHNLDLKDIQIIEPMEEEEQRQVFAGLLHAKRKRKGLTEYDAFKLMRDRNYYGAMMVQTGQADAFISGLTKNYPTAMRPALQTIGVRPEAGLVAGMHIIKTNKGTYFFADTTVNKTPTADQLVTITLMVAEAIRLFNVRPKIAMLSYSNFGSNQDEQTAPVAEATRILHELHPELIVDGEVQFNVALRRDILEENYNFSPLAHGEPANTFIFPNLMASNIAYKMMGEIGGAEVIGPILLGMNKPVHILQLGSTVREIVNMGAIAVIDAQEKERQERRRDTALKAPLV
jgi:malate dehydrogenase (oxaloacetate-decarboxylating)(NADP+)